MAYLAVAIGGFLGACVRYAIQEWMGTWGGFPAATLIINSVGSFLLAWFYTITLERLPVHPHLRVGLGTGFIGAFTTFSTLNLELWTLWSAAEYKLALLYLCTTYGLGLLAAGSGYLLAVRQSQLRMTRETGRGVFR